MHSSIAVTECVAHLVYLLLHTIYEGSWLPRDELIAVLVGHQSIRSLERKDHCDTAGKEGFGGEDGGKVALIFPLLCT